MGIFVLSISLKALSRRKTKDPGHRWRGIISCRCRQRGYRDGRTDWQSVLQEGVNGKQRDGRTDWQSVLRGDCYTENRSSARGSSLVKEDGQVVVGEVRHGQVLLAVAVEIA